MSRKSPRLKVHAQILILRMIRKPMPRPGQTIVDKRAKVARKRRKTPDSET